MANQSKRVLATGLSRDRVDRFEEALTRLDFELVLEEDPFTAGERLHEGLYDAIVAGYPLQEGAVGGLIRAVKGRESQNFGAGLVLLAQPDRLRAAASLVGRGVHKALSIEEDPAVLGIVVQRMVEVSRPMLERLPLNLEVTARFENQVRQWMTENISGSGMLIAADNPPRTGTRFAFDLQLPAEQIEGEARVVRSTLEGRELVDGFGVRFSRFKMDGQRRLLDFLREARA
jgi:hypothetical protein